jgi:hypothetical protein
MLTMAQTIVVKANPFLFGPEWKIWLPEQFNAKTYQTSSVPIEIQINTPPDYPKIVKIYYIVDLNYSSNNNIQKALSISKPQSSTYHGKSSISYLATGTTDNLSNGTHAIDFYAVNAEGKTLKSSTRTFQVNATSTAKSDQSLIGNLIFALIAIVVVAIGDSVAVIIYRRKTGK